MPKEFLHYGKSSRTKTDFPTWGPGKGPENLQGIWLWRPVGFDYRISTGLGKQSLEGHKQNLMCTQEKGTVTPSVDWARLACECLGVSGGGMGWQWSAAGLGVLTNRVLRGLAYSHKPFWRRWPYCHYPCYREGTQPHPAARNWLKIYRHGLVHQSKAKFSPQPVPSVRKLPQASYPSEDRQNENHNPYDWLNLNCKFIPLHLLHLFHPAPIHFPSDNHLLSLFSFLWVSLFLYCFIC